MRVSFLFAVILVAVGFAMPAQAGGCNFKSARPWAPFAGQSFSTEAYSNGPGCVGAVATILVRDGKGRVLWTEAMAVEHVMTFAGVTSPSRMVAALSDWLKQQHLFRSSADLPVWRKGAESPGSVGEFPFYVAAGVDQGSYEEIRAQRSAMFCYVQGMESLACVAIGKDGTATKVGVQSFPG